MSEETLDKTEEIEKIQKDLSDKVLKLELENQSLKKTYEEKLEKLNDKVLRFAAENENLIKRHKEQLEKSSKYAITNLATELISVKENFYMSFNNLAKEKIESSDESLKKFVEAIIMNKKELDKIFDRYDITRIFPEGEVFNPDFHEAVSQVESEKDSGVIQQVIQAGYSIHDRLLRPALVSVSKKKNKE